MIVRTLSTNLCIQVITFVTSVLTARILGPVGRGELALVLLYPQIVAGTAFLGMDRAIAVLGGRGELVRPIASLINLALLLSIPAMGLGYVTVIWRVGDPHLAGLATVYLIYVPAVYFFMLASFLFNGTGDFARFNLVRLGFYFVNLALLLVIWTTAPTMSLDWVVLANLVSVYGGLALAVWLLRGFQYAGGSSKRIGKITDIKNVLRLALVFAIPAALAQFGGSIYQVILEHQLGVRPLGLFVVFYSYSRILSPAGGAIASHVFYHGITGEDRDIARICRFSLIVFILCSLPLWLISWWIIPLIFGRGFVVDLWVIGFLLISCMFALMADNMAEYLKGHQLVRAETWGRVIYLVTVVILGWRLVAIWGLIGMAFAIALADILRYSYLVGNVGRLIGQSTREFWHVTRSDFSALITSGRTVLVGVCKG